MKTMAKEGYTALQLGAGSKRDKQLSGSELGHFRAASVPAKREVVEFRVSSVSGFTVCSRQTCHVLSEHLAECSHLSAMIQLAASVQSRQLTPPFCVLCITGRIAAGRDRHTRQPLCTGPVCRCHRDHHRQGLPGADCFLFARSAAEAQFACAAAEAQLN